MFSSSWQHHRNSRQQVWIDQFEPSTTSPFPPPPPPPHTHAPTPVRWEIWTWSVKLTPFFLSVGIHMVCSWSSSSGKIPLLWTIGSSKRASANFAVFSRKFSWLWMNQFSNNVYQKLEHLCLGRGIRLSSMAHGLGIWTAFWPCGAANLEFDINLVWVLNTFQSYSDIK